MRSKIIAKCPGTCPSVAFVQQQCEPACKAAGGMCSPEDGLLIPALSPDAHCTAGGVILYMFLLLWCFLAVAIIADIFMAAIETITSKEVSESMQVRKEVGSADFVEREFTVKIWNDTVANLTLMALGSSAPEILLSVIEVMSNDFYSGSLGPSTIVGSAAFNLFVILAVCVMCIPEGEIRTIHDFKVFLITGISSVKTPGYLLWAAHNDVLQIFAYVWLAFILVVSTPDIVDVWEGVLTFLFFPILVVLAYMADAKKGCFKESDRPLNSKLLEVRGPDGKPLSTQELVELSKIVRDKYGSDLSPEENAALIAKEASKSRAFYRVQATRNMSGSCRVSSEAVSHSQTAVVVPEKGDTLEDTQDSPLVFFEWPEVDCHSYGGQQQNIEVTVCRNHPDNVCSVNVLIRSHNSDSSSESIAPLVADFEANKKTTVVSLELTETIKNMLPFELYLDQPSIGLIIDPGRATCLVVSDKDDFSGMFAFEQERLRVSEDCHEAVLNVIRKYGSHGAVSCSWATKDATAVAGSDYEAAEGKLNFEDGEVSKEIRILIYNDDGYELEEHFYVEIFDAVGCTFDPTTDGLDERCTAKITIVDNDQLTSWVDKLLPFLSINRDAVALGNTEYKQQFITALKVNGGETKEEATALDWVLHIFSVFWKLLFAIVPPCRFCGGWLTFTVALIFIGGLTAVIGDLATLMGSAMGLKDAVTAITFVALGTSLPDTFASKTAAVQDRYADAAIGNVTGSNAVNIFLGLGLPWLIASAYWTGFAPDSEKSKWLLKYCGSNPTQVSEAIKGCSGTDVGFAVPAGDLGISVGVFTGGAVLCLGTIILRRIKYGAELGGPQSARVLTAIFFCLLWAAYVGVSSYLAYRYFPELFHSGVRREVQFIIN